MPQAPGPAKSVGRAAVTNPPNRFERIEAVFDADHLAADDELLAAERRVATVFYADASRSLITQNDSPDIPFRFSINPYRGCEHG